MNALLRIKTAVPGPKSCAERNQLPVSGWPLSDTTTLKASEKYMSEHVPMENPSGAVQFEVCTTSTQSNSTDIRKQRLTAIRAILHDSALRNEARKTRGAASSARAAQNIRFRHLETRYGWTYSEFLQYLALPSVEREKCLDRERKRVKAPERKNAKPKEMTPAERARHRTEQNRLAKKRQRAKKAMASAANRMEVSEEELQVLIALEGQNPVDIAYAADFADDPIAATLQMLRLAEAAETAAERSA